MFSLQRFIRCGAGGRLDERRCDASRQNESAGIRDEGLGLRADRGGNSKAGR